MAHIHTKPGEHDQTASAFIFRLDGSEPRVILHHHKKLKTLLQFGGHIEIQETPWQAVAHEITEESGYEFDQLRLMQPKNRLRTLDDVTLHPLPATEFTHAFSPTHNHTDRSYIFVTREEPRRAVAKGESQDIRLFTRAQLLALTSTEILQNVQEVCLYAMDHCLNSPLWETVPVTDFAL